MRRRNRKNPGRMLVITGTFVLIAVCAVLACSYVLGLTASAMSPQPAIVNTSADDGGTANENGTMVDWSYWKDVNPDIVGWLEIPDTNIDLPVVQADKEDPTFYLYHDVYGNWNYHGCPYVDADCPNGLASRNAIILGHNLVDGTMFTELENYHDRGFAEQHRLIVLYTPESTRTLAVAGCETIVGAETVKRAAFIDDQDFESFVEERLSACSVQLGGERPYANLVTLCTCSYFFNPADERTLVYAF